MRKYSLFIIEEIHKYAKARLFYNKSIRVGWLYILEIVKYIKTKLFILVA